MLQQTQVETVIPYFERFISCFPTIIELCNSPLDKVLHQWSGLGYYARARNLHKTAQILCSKFDAKLPQTVEQLTELPGIGLSTAGAILSLGFNQPAAILDGNVKRVLCRYFAIENWPGKASVLKKLWSITKDLTPEKNCASFNQAMMDMGATLCTRSNPQCHRCPLSESCLAYKNNAQHLYPFKKPSKKIPTKQQTFLFITNENNQVLLLQRPPAGIWGSLWCLPEKEQLDPFIPQLESELPFKTFTHKFSHFSLQASIYQLNWEICSMVMDAPSLCWYDPYGEHQIGIPQPIMEQLTAYFRDQNNDTNGSM